MLDNYPEVNLSDIVSFCFILLYGLLIAALRLFTFNMLSLFRLEGIFAE